MECNGYANDNSQLCIFCHEGEEKNIYSVWKTIYFQLHVQSSNYKIFLDHSVEEVHKKYNESLESWFQLLPWQTDRANIAVFNSTCVGISSEKHFRIHFIEKKIDFWKISLLVAGLILFFCAQELSRNSFFHYSTGISLGVGASLLILVFIIGRLVPKKTGALTFIFGGWAFVLFLLQKLYSNIKSVLLEYKNYIAGYILIIGFISFAVCYRYGPVKDHRTLNLIKWILQIVGLLLIFLSSEWQEFSMSIVLIVCVIHIFPNSWLNRMKIYWKRRFPPKLQLLTEEEYHQQASRETDKALQELRKFCNSPQCNSWKLISNLSSPMRFSDFAQGSSHLSDEEILEYEISGFKFEDSDEEIAD